MYSWLTPALVNSFSNVSTCWYKKSSVPISIEIPGKLSFSKYVVKSGVSGRFTPELQA